MANTGNRQDKPLSANSIYLVACLLVPFYKEIPQTEQMLLIRVAVSICFIYCVINMLNGKSR